MSRAPLFLRSSPAQGTGSYGALPVHHLSSSASPSESEDNTDFDGQTSGQSGTRKRKLSAAAESSNAVRKRNQTAAEAVEGQQESGLEIRFTTNAGMPAAVGMDATLEDLHISSGSATESSDSGSEDDALSDDHMMPDKHPSHDPPDNSPYPQVRASVRPTDDTSLSINTPRMWTLSMLFSILGSSTNLFFSLRYPSVSITPVIALLLVHPLGLLWDQLLTRDDDPDELFVDGSLLSHILDANPSMEYLSTSWRRRFRLWLAQGHWNEKEHCCVYIASNVSFGFAFATDVIVEQTKFYHQETSVIYQILLTLSTQILGYAIAGITRRFLVRPSGMIWPGTLISTSMFTTLHNDENHPANGWHISRSKFFLYVFCGSFAFYFIPGLLMPALSYFNVITWFAPKNVIIANLFGTSSGLGLFPVTFDWSQIAYIGSPLVVPFWAAMNIVSGLVVIMFIVAPILYYSNVLYSSYMPILSSAVFDNTGKPYDVSKILTPDFLFDEEAYHKYSRVFMPMTYVLSYALQFAALAALITHTACWHGRDIIKQWRRSLDEIRSEDKAMYRRLSSGDGSEGMPDLRRMSSVSSTSGPGLDNLMSAEDVHNRLMRRYEDVPISWYLLTGVSMTAVGMFVVEYYPIHLPWYGLLLSLGICTLLFIPIGIVMAITNQQSSLYLICQLICGVVFPGRPVANMVFVTYGYITSTQGLKFSSDLKLGHYMKIPPRILFKLQLLATTVSSLTQIGVLNWMLTHIRGICTPAAINGFTCPIARVHFNGSILWGVVGPARFFGPGALYRPLVWAFLVGAIAPVGVWMLGRRHRKSFWRNVNLPVLFGSLSWIPPATGLNFSVWALVCWFFNCFVQRRYRAWWGKYTMTTSAGLDSSVAVGVVVVFFAFGYTGLMDRFRWWGTEVYKQGCDWHACSYKTVPEGEIFGPKTW
ncbi:hypothetical protein W97_04568 [Coniosporium apollinis CBS 100218]|uniref:OPT family small oligopeptide transporter n=1 Tax=Coniosporium apollinis (strain CBS 100218) TaxID=1168221 RepID=R7YTV9_CONA1|nr:uncharacterized protein W97_04568 [Coniosporium apollinis CBS 100218]EON65330.1 hypothetical protein W97_04568 [Coniosporium apollinis CBS 100218]